MIVWSEAKLGIFFCLSQLDIAFFISLFLLLEKESILIVLE